MNVRSAVPDNNFALYSGTSMAAPHVAGSIALLLSAGVLKDVRATAASYFHQVPGEKCATIVGDVPWLTASTPTVDVLAEDSTSVEYTIDASGLAPGTYHATILANTTDPGASQLWIPVEVTVT